MVTSPAFRALYKNVVHKTAWFSQDTRHFPSTFAAKQEVARAGELGSLLLSVALISLVVGARSRNILMQFLIEAVVLCLLGGAVGILMGRGGSALVRLPLGWPTEISIGAIDDWKNAPRAFRAHEHAQRYSKYMAFVFEKR